MASRKNRRPSGTESLIDLADRRYWGRGNDVRVMNALLYLGLAREAAERNDFERACRGYRKALETWHAANATMHDAWAREQDLTNREYASFLMGSHQGAA